MFKREIERKFLLRNDGWRPLATSRRFLRDGLIAHFALGKVRVRIEADRAWLTIKGPRSGLARAEFDYEISRDDAEAMMSIFSDGNVIEKERHLVPYDGLTWEVDVYRGVLEGLVLAEVELDEEDQRISIPEWVGDEVTGNARYQKRNLFLNFRTGKSDS